MVAAKTERLLNLVICLLYTRRPLTRAQIRSSVAQYAETPSDDAFERMFERDKEELRELGIPLVTEQLDSFFEDEPGYRIDRREYAVPELRLAPDELAVLSLASRTWAQASLGGPAAQALRKLAADGVERDESSIIGIEARVRTVEPAFDAVRAAVVDTCPIAFTYRTNRSGEVRERHVQPWGLASWHGRWYLTGYDIDRADTRVFRVGRIEGEVRRDGPPGSYVVPAGHQPRALIRLQARDGEPVTVTCRVRAGAGHALRRRAESIAPAQGAAPASSAEPMPAMPSAEAGWDRLTLITTDVEALADELAGYGPDVVAESPEPLVAGVVRRLRGAFEAHGAGSTS
ncbi:MAG: WYL domain-containing protein [Austwickia sp.]|nr:MAG: WYL domain-containing protein [Austwickia sp.]